MKSFNTKRFDEKVTEKSSSTISNYISLNATLAASIQITTEILPGNISRKNNLKSIKMEQALTSALALSKPIMDMATRGIMVQKGFIEFDEVDMGWIIGETIDDTSKWNYSNNMNIGRLCLFSPIAAAAGYLLSENANNPDYEINMDDLQKYALDFLINTTPEDTVQLFGKFYNFPELSRFPFLCISNETFPNDSTCLLKG